MYMYMIQYQYTLLAEYAHTYIHTLPRALLVKARVLVSGLLAGECGCSS